MQLPSYAMRSRGCVRRLMKFKKLLALPLLSFTLLAQHLKKVTKGLETKMNLSNFILAAKKIANREERFCCHALNQDSVEYEIFNKLFNPHDAKALRENKHRPWWDHDRINKQRLARTLALLLAYEICLESVYELR